MTVNLRNGRHVADTDAYSVFVDTRVEVVVYCSIHNLDRGFVNIYLKFIKFQLTMASRQSDSANRTVVYSVMCMR
jgi:hypothetical protein